MTPFIWKSHPAKERPIAAIFVILFCLFMFYFVYIYTHSFMMLSVAFIVMFFSLSSFFFPTSYTIDHKARMKCLFTRKERNMTAFRAVYPGKKGVLLSPYVVPTRLENFRGFYLRYGKDNKEEVDDYLKQYIEWQNQNRAEKAKQEKENAS